MHLLRTTTLIYRPVPGERAIRGQYVKLNDDRVYQICNSHLLPEFFMTLVSSHDHWMFISSEGAITAGRSNANSALFPYYSADKLSDMRHCTGPLTLVRIKDATNRVIRWQPFDPGLSVGGQIQRNIYKNDLGNRLWLEEVHESLGLVFRYQWTFGERLGFVRSSELQNTGDRNLTIELLDGIQNILPYGIDQQFQLRFSNLADAYKKSELDAASGMGIYYLSSIPTDRAEPSEGLRATTVWQTGLPDPHILLSRRQLSQFMATGQVTSESDIRAHRGAYFATQTLSLCPGETTRWRMVASLNQDQSDVMERQQLITSSQDIDGVIDSDIASCQEGLLKILSAADGRQLGEDALRVHRHQSNVLFNVMRGGMPLCGYLVSRSDFTKHVRAFNSAVYDRNHSFLEELPDQIHIESLLQQLSDQNEPDLLRIGLEYLPFGFSRRHGDPTRPWNKFEIRLQDETGAADLNYQGNWRDIFQNWEALALSWPGFSTSMVFRFLNASTADGYNPYRITKNGIEWETPDPADPWANIGYWGDHQIVYLLRLLEWTRRLDPKRLDQWLDAEYCTYSQVPYRIRTFEQIRQNPRESIDFDFDLAEQIDSRVRKFGADGKLLQNRDGGVYRATLGEKLLVPALTKMTNFVPEGGIWLNTQRPEWNDANNALAGFGLSMVTVCHLRRYLAFLDDWFATVPIPHFLVSKDMVQLMQSVHQILLSQIPQSGVSVDAAQRAEIVESTSAAGSAFRQALYDRGLSGDKVYIRVDQCRDWFQVCLQHLDHTIHMNRRDDGLYHSYNLIQFSKPESNSHCDVEHLYEMLEGQVAVLSSGVLDSEGAANVLEALRNSRMYRPDQNSYMLYPDRALPRFVEKNSVSNDLIDESKLVADLLEQGDGRLVVQDIQGGLHFHADFRNVKDLNQRLNELANDPRFTDLVAADRALLESCFETTFGHRYFTGRSGTFFGYEGLGSIYWHMVSKLCLAAQECLLAAIADSADAETINRLGKRYREIRNGTGIEKTPQQYGAFPMDPYSHTPWHAGAQQPGMTGQVKEDILCRITEVGLRIRQGIVSFEPVLFDTQEFLQKKSQLSYFDTQMKPCVLPLEEGSFAFTVCQVPVVYQQGSETRIAVHFGADETVTRSGNCLTARETQQLFQRTHSISRIELAFSPADFCEY